MNRLFYVFYLLFIVVSAKSQITITNSILPSVGDVNYYSIDTVPTNLTLGNIGANQSWDFSKLKSNRMNQETYKSVVGAVGAASFPTANLVTSNQGTNSFYRVTNKSLYLLGTFAQGNPVLSGPNVLDNPAEILRTPLDYTDIYSYTVKQAFQISGAFIPDSLTMGLTIDSVRINITQDVVAEIDAWGKAKLISNSYDVLRQKRVTTSIIKVEAKVPFINWIDVTNLAGPLFARFLNAAPSTQYVFLSNQSKGYIASITVDSLGNPTTASFKNENVGTYNPAIDYFLTLESNIIDNSLVLINSSNESKNISIEIKALNGLSLRNFDFQIANGRNQIDIANIPSSLYFLNVTDKNNKLVTSFQFMKK